MDWPGKFKNSYDKLNNIISSILVKPFNINLENESDYVRSFVLRKTIRQQLQLLSSVAKETTEESIKKIISDHKEEISEANGLIRNDEYFIGRIKSREIPTRDEAIRLYNKYGFIEFITSLYPLITSDLDTLREKLLDTGVKITDKNIETRLWTVKIKSGGKYLGHNFLQMNDTPKKTLGLSPVHIDKFILLRLEAKQPEYENIPKVASSKVSVYNSSLEKLILSKIPKCYKYQIRGERNIEYYIKSFIDFTPVIESTSIEELPNNFLTALWKVMIQIVIRQNPGIKHPRELYFIYGMVYQNVIPQIYDNMLNELHKHKFKLPAITHDEKDTVKIIITSALKNILEKVNLSRYNINAEREICM